MWDGVGKCQKAGKCIFEYDAEIWLVTPWRQIYAEPIGYWLKLWNWFDFVVLWVTIALAIIEFSSERAVTVLRIIRTLRIVCVFRLLNHVRGLQILMLAFFKTITEWVAPAILLLLITMYIFAIISDHYFNSEDVWWGNIGRCLISLMAYFSVRTNTLPALSSISNRSYCRLKFYIVGMNIEFRRFFLLLWLMTFIPGETWLVSLVKMYPHEQKMNFLLCQGFRKL